MNKKILLIFMLLLTIAILTWVFQKDIFQDGDFKLIQTEFEVNQADFDVANTVLNVKFDANAVLTSISRDEFILTLYLSSLSGNIPLEIDESNIYAYIKNNGSQIYGKIEIEPYSKTGQNIATSLVMDYSGSMEYNIGYLETAVKSFLNNYNSGDQAEIIKFGSNLDIITNYTNDKDLLIKKVGENSRLRSGTALYSSIYQAISNSQQIDNQKYSKAIVAFTDGGDNQSNVSLEETAIFANKNLIPVFCVGLISSDYDPNSLKSVAKNTGGFFYETPNPEKLSELYNRINTSMRNSYIVKVKWNRDELPASGTEVPFILRVLDNKVAITELNKNIIIP
jgi:hypothetical protein